MDPTREFLANFHNLKGFSVGEKRKNLFILLNNMKSLDSESLNLVVSSVTPKDYLESIFRVELLIYFKRSEEMLQVLKNDNEDLSTKIFKQSWYFQEPFDGFSAEFIVNDFLPHLSFVTRNRVIKCLAKYNKNEARNDQIFDRLLERYGINSAEQIIRGCTVKKTEDIIKSNCFELSTPDLIAIFNKDPHLFEVYVKCNSVYDYDRCLIQEVILKEPDMYFNMKDRFQCIKLGKHSTKRLLNHCKEKVTSGAYKFCSILHLKTVYKFLGKQNTLLFLQNLFHNNHKEYTFNKVKPFLKQFPKAEQFKCFTDAFEKAYKKTIWDANEYLHDELFESIQNEEDRMKWIDIKIKSGVSPERFYPFYEITKALSLIKEKINVTSAATQKRVLIVELVLACKINNDVQALRDVLQYFCKHHKRDEVLKYAFLNTVELNFDLSKLSEEHWKYINQILHTEQGNQWKKIFKKHLVYLWKNKLPLKETVKEMIVNEDLMISDLHNLDFESKEFEREMIKAIGEILPEIANSESRSVSLFNYIMAYNINNCKNKIALSDFPRLINSVKRYVENTVKEEEYIQKLSWLFQVSLASKEHDEFQRCIAEIYFEHGFERYQDTSVILRYLKHDPHYLLKYVDKIVKALSTSCFFESEILYYIKKLTYLGMREKCIEFCLEHYTQDSNASTMLWILAHLMHPEDYVNVVSKHVPELERLDIDDESSKKNYRIEIAVADSLKYTKSVTALPTLICFCIGDYLGSALESLYYLFYHSPENKLYAFLKELSDRAVSVRKHTFFLVSQVGSAQSVFTLLKYAAEHEKNASMKKHLLNTTFRYFKKNPLDNFFDLLISSIPSLNINDKESLEVIQSVSDIPRKFQGRYFAFVLKFLTSRTGQDSEAWKQANRFLGQINDSMMKQLPYDFCVLFIEKYSLKSNHCFDESNIKHFMEKFLYYCDHDFKEKVNVIMKELAKHLRDNADDIEKKVAAYRKVDSFLSYLKYCSTSDRDIAHIQIIHSEFLECFSVEEFIGVYIHLRSLLIRREFPNITEYITNLNLFLDELTKISSTLISYLAESVKRCLRYERGYEDILFELCFGLYKINQNVNTCLLILLLLPNKQPEKHKSETFFCLLNSIESHIDVSVREALNAYLFSLQILDTPAD